MKIRPAISVYTLFALTAGLLLTANAAHAQFRPRPIEDPATGERYHVEAAAGLWFPTADLTISSQALGQLGSMIDVKKDLGLTDDHFSELHLVLRPAKIHKFRFQYIPIAYEQTAALPREIVFNGQKYVVGLPVSSMLDWKAYRFGYEYDFISKDRAYGGFIFDIKYTEVSATLLSPITPPQFTNAKAPIPAIGGIFRVYPVPNVSITGEVTGFKLPENLIKDTQGHYVDIDFYGTLNFTNYIGAQVGYRSFDVGYGVDADSGSFQLRGLYFGVVARY
jgi:hypothetical protein